MSTAAIALRAPFVPNIAPAGWRRRRRFGLGWAAISVGALGVAVWLRAPSLVRALVVAPATLAAIGFLQARRQTCVLRAREGTFEGDDFSTKKAPPAQVAASRQVASGINRDAVWIGLGAGAFAASTSLVR
jgi:hypothetical protein